MARLVLVLMAVCIISTPCLGTGEEAVPSKNPIGNPAQTAPHKIPRLAASAKIVDITDTTIRVERTVKGNEEAMDLDLEKPAKGIKSGDKVRIHYMEKDGRLVVIKITKINMKLKAPAVNKEGNVAGEQNAIGSKGR